MNKTAVRIVLLAIVLLVITCSSALSPICESGDYTCSRVYPNGDFTDCSTFPDSVACKKCQAECERQSALDAVTEIVYVVTGGLAILLLSVHGFRFFMSDAEGREDAKRGATYVVLGMVVVLVAVNFTSYMIGDLFGSLTEPSCAEGQQRLCPQQDGVCEGSMETCTNQLFWPGCNETTYLAHNSSYNLTESNCSDTLDNDCDGLTDLNDPDCPTLPPTCERQGGRWCSAGQPFCPGKIIRASDFQEIRHLGKICCNETCTEGYIPP